MRKLPWLLPTVAALLTVVAFHSISSTAKPSKQAVGTELPAGELHSLSKKWWWSGPY